MASGEDVARVAIKERDNTAGAISYNNNNKYNTWYYGHEVSGADYPWCAVFVSWCCMTAGVPESVVPKSAWTGEGGLYDFVPSDRIHPIGDGYVPSPGDFMLRKGQHIGIIVSCNGNTFTTVEGNTAGEGPNNRTVASHDYVIGSGNYTHIICPEYGEIGSTMTADWIQRDVPNIGADLATKAYMDYRLITATDTKNYQISHASDASTAEGGLRWSNNKFYQVAMGSYYGGPGTYVKVKFDDENVIYCIITDQKKDSETDSRHMYHDYPFDRNVLEFVIDGGVVKNNDDFTSSLQAQNINRSTRISAIWTSDSEPQYSSSDGTGEKETHFQNTNEVIPLHPTLFNQVDIVPPYSDISMYAAGTDITQYITDLSWSNTVDELSTSMNFNVPKSAGTQYLNMYVPLIGDIVRYYNGAKEVFRGVIITVDDSDDKNNKYTIVDAGWYLNKCQDTYQFNAAKAEDCIKKILGDLSIPIAMLPKLTTKITGVYIDKAVSEIIKDILSQCGGGYNFDFVPEGIRIYKIGDIVADPQFHLSDNTKANDSIKYKYEVSHSTSVEEMHTAFKAISETDVLQKYKNDALYKKFGFIQKNISVSEGDSADAAINNEIAANTCPKETFSFSIVEDITSYTRAGSCIVGTDNVIYYLNSTQHSIKNGVHYNKIEVKRLAA